MIFSIPINPKLDQTQFNIFYNFCEKYKHLIYDLYFTCRMPPFVQDAMGDVILNDNYATIENALNIQEHLDIPISATFNNILVRPDQNNLDLFIQNFGQLYDSGIKIATIPHTQWLLTGQIQKIFPELKIKNTILRNVDKANQVAKLAEAGFHYVNVDRDLMRDLDELEKMKRVSDKYDIELSLLANENCLGNCPVMDEHYHFNNSRRDVNPQYFNDPISRVSCDTWSQKDLSTDLKNANIPPWKEDWDELLNYVNVFKMHGRENVDVLFGTMDIVRRYADNQEFLHDNFEEYLNDNNMNDKSIHAWRKKIKNCKFDCWDCNFCDTVYENKSNLKPNEKVLQVLDAIDESALVRHKFERIGLTSLRVQNLIHELSLISKNYLEIGCGFGAITQCITRNHNIENIFCVDNWSDEHIQPQNYAFELEENTKEEFLKNVDRGDITLFDEDLMNVNVKKIKNVDLFFYDGPKDKIEDCVKYYKDCFDKTCVMIFDDANWEGVVYEAQKGIVESNLNILYDKKLLNEVEDLNNWWNGLYIVITNNESI